MCREKKINSSKQFSNIAKLTTKSKMAGKLLKNQNAGEFIHIWREGRSLWDIKSQIYKDRNAKLRSYDVFKEKLNTEG